MLTPAQVDSFNEHGFLVVPDVLDAGDLAPVVSEYEDALDLAANWLFQRGEISSSYEGLSFSERYIAIVRENPSVFYFLGISLPLDYENLDPDLVRVHTGPALFGLLRNHKLLDIAESIVGGEITLNPVQQMRLKPPQRLLSGPAAEYSNIGATTWHQDFGAVMDEAADTDLLTIWIAMTDATTEMGCLQAIPGSHRERSLTLHCPGSRNAAENYIPQVLLDRHPAAPQPLPCTAGSVVLLSKYTEHGALLNTSNQLRWSLDLRYQPTSQPTGRPAFPSFVLRSRAQPETEVTDPAQYAAGWEETRLRIVSGAQEDPLYEQGRWLANQANPVCA